MVVNWQPIKDRHQEGKTPLGPVWIRLGREGEVLSWYTCFLGETSKWCAEPDDTIELVRLWLQEALDRHLLAEEISKKER
jgi:hypothetical protein